MQVIKKLRKETAKKTGVNLKKKTNKQTKPTKFRKLPTLGNKTNVSDY